MSEVNAQRQYYADTAARYDEMHMDCGNAHHRALDWLPDLMITMASTGPDLYRQAPHLALFAAR